MKEYIIDCESTLYDALRHMNDCKIKFLVVVDSDKKVIGTLTDGDVRRGILNGLQLNESFKLSMCTHFTWISRRDSLSRVLEAFKDARIQFLPVLDEEGCLHNIITRRGLHSLLLKNLSFSMDFDFKALDENSLEHEIFARPWGFYKTTILNDVFQSKVIHVMPEQALSLQSHHRREEYWTVVYGEGLIQIGESVHPAIPGSTYFIPKGCKHRLINTSHTAALIVTEVQLGDYFGEDDITRYEDQYNRC